jgi:hypothetical protein
MHAMGSRAKPLRSEQEFMRPFAEKARNEIGLTELCEKAGIEGSRDYNAVHRWLEGREDGKGKRRYTALPKRLGYKLWHYLRDRYTSEFNQAIKAKCDRSHEEQEIWLQILQRNLEVQKLEEQLKELKKKGRG